MLTRAFGVPAVLAAALRPVEGITETYVYGSWTARSSATMAPDRWRTSM
ncbi:MAG: hypothetical protein H0U21_04310 [Acidimicrobiia bacterium]|nr:hypothetical protein [Acidimicrobiia bacterium]